MTRFRIIMSTLAAVAVAAAFTVPSSVTLAGGKGGGKKPATTVAAVLETLPPDTTEPEETWPPTTTIPFDPGTEISGNLSVVASNLVYGGSITFDTTFTGTPSNRGTLYVTTVCSQNGRVVYQWSQWDDDLTFPFEDQAGDGLDWLGGSATCEAWYIYRILNDKDHSYQTLDKEFFSVSG